VVFKKSRRSIGLNLPLRRASYQLSGPSLTIVLRTARLPSGESGRVSGRILGSGTQKKKENRLTRPSFKKSILDSNISAGVKSSQLECGNWGAWNWVLGMELLDNLRLSALFSRWANAPATRILPDTAPSRCCKVVLGSWGGGSMRSLRFLFQTFAIFLIVLFAASTSNAQSDRGTVAGTILDSSGAVVQGATIVATGVDTGAVYKTTSTDTGAYRISDMQLGAYNLTVTAAGFKTSEQKGLVVQVNTTSSLDITLQAGDVKETLTVLADMPTLQTETSDVGTIVDKRQIMELPLALGGQGVLRAPEAFVFLTPGTTGPGSNDSSNGVFEAKLGGGQNFGNEVILDGASTARSDSGSAFDQTAPSVEALQEFKVTTSTVPAEFGRTSGGVESFATRSGANTYHGTAYDIFRNEDLNANSWFNNLQHQPRNLDRKNDYGGTFGGPVWIPKLYNGHDKTFFFFSWEQYRQTQGSTITSTVPTAAERAGDFSSLLTTTSLGINPCDGSTIFQGQIFDPRRRKQSTASSAALLFQETKFLPSAPSPRTF
jgi:hypothetical protein